MTAASHRNGLDAEPIRYAIAASWLGPTLVAQSNRGLCAIFMGDDPQALAADLQRRFPRAVLTASNTRSLQWVAQTVSSLESPGGATGLPLDLRGTAFQHRVWHSLLDIPAGRTATYTDIAQRIGSPRAVRAVAQACGANPLAVLVPCHRVIGRDGSLSGYRWGVDRKRALLEREAAQPRLAPSA